MHTRQHLFDKNKNYKNTTSGVQKNNNTLNNCKNTNKNGVKKIITTCCLLVPFRVELHQLYDTMGLPCSHMCPVHPGGHWHLYPWPLLLQVPPFWQDWVWQSLPNWQSWQKGIHEVILNPQVRHTDFPDLLLYSLTYFTSFPSPSSGTSAAEVIGIIMACSIVLARWWSTEVYSYITKTKVFLSFININP